MPVKSFYDLGTDVVRSVVEDLFQKIMNDGDLFPFFSHMRLSFLKIHSLNLLKTAYVGDISDDQLKRIFEHHSHLFREQGLRLVHFNKMIVHVQESLVKNGIVSDVIHESMESLSKFKQIFQHGENYCVPVIAKKTLTSSEEEKASYEIMEEQSISPNSYHSVLRKKMIRSPSFMRRSVRIITKGAA